MSGKNKKKRKIGEIFNPYKMFNGIFIPEQICKWDLIRPVDKLVYGRLYRFAGKDGKCWPSYQTLADEIGVSKSHVIKSVKRLEHHNLIYKRSPNGMDKLMHKGCDYYFLWHPLFDETIDKKTHDSQKNPNTVGGDYSDQGGDYSDQGGDYSDQGGDYSVTPEIHQSVTKESHIRESYKESQRKEVVVSSQSSLKDGMVKSDNNKKGKGTQSLAKRRENIDRIIALIKDENHECFTDYVAQEVADYLENRFTDSSTGKLIPITFNLADSTIIKAIRSSLTSPNADPNYIDGGIIHRLQRFTRVKEREKALERINGEKKKIQDIKIQKKSDARVKKIKHFAEKVNQWYRCTKTLEENIYDYDPLEQRSIKNLKPFLRYQPIKAIHYLYILVNYPHTFTQDRKSDTELSNYPFKDIITDIKKEMEEGKKQDVVESVLKRLDLDIDSEYSRELVRRASGDLMKENWEKAKKERSENEREFQKVAV